LIIEPTRRQVVGGLSLVGAAALLPGRLLAEAAPQADAEWVRLPTEPYHGKQDDITFVNPDIGWYGNGKGRVYATRDGGANWSLLWEKPGTYVRALGFIDEKVGILGNIGVDDFPDVTDTNPVYRTTDGGRTFVPVTAIQGPVPKGICAIDILRHPYINAGVLASRITVRAGGRVGGPAFLMTSHDLGESWTSEDMSSLTGAILDIHFVDERTGFIAGASDPDVDKSNAVVLMTSDGGRSWRRVYQSARPFEITWKLSFPSPRVGYVTVQNYDDDVNAAKRVVAKTTDGGRTWHELALATDHKLREFGIGFLDERRGWIGGSTGGYETRDGGRSWRPVSMGLAVNKIRILRHPGGVRLFAIGQDVHRLDLPA
jgi:photosystem II stability/assembly factor-like uncharacterized protein